MGCGRRMLAGCRKGLIEGSLNDLWMLVRLIVTVVLRFRPQLGGVLRPGVGEVVMMSPDDVRVMPYGDRALLVELDGLDDVLALHATLREQLPAGVTELVPAARTLLVMFEPKTTTAQRLVDDISGRPIGPRVAPRAPLVEIPVVYDGADLADVAAQTGFSAPEVIARHSRPTYVVAFNGFAPGFAYLTGLDPGLTLPRRQTPRTRVPAGAVAIADQFSGIYPRSAPGGWHIIGRTDVALWDPTRDPPTLLRPGSRVRFVPL